MMSHFNDDDVNLVGDCAYTNLASVNVDTFTNSILHLNMRSIRHKTAELEVIPNLLGLPKVVMITETWLTSDSSLTNITLVILFCDLPEPSVMVEVLEFMFMTVLNTALKLSHVR